MTNTNINPLPKASTEKEENFCDAEKFVGYESRPTGTCYTVRLYGYRPRATRHSPLNTPPQFSGDILAKITKKATPAYIYKAKKRAKQKEGCS